MLISGFLAGRRRWAAALAASVTSSTLFGRAGSSLRPPTRSPSVPAPQLDWRPCAQDSAFDCATAKVPLDYRRPGWSHHRTGGRQTEGDRPRTAHRHPVLQPRRSRRPRDGADAAELRVLPAQVRERFDIVSWDPRGIGNSTAVNCFDEPRGSRRVDRGQTGRLPGGRTAAERPGSPPTGTWPGAASGVTPSSCAMCRPPTPHSTSTSSAGPWATRNSPTSASPTARSWAPPTPTSSPARSAPWSSTATSTRRPGRTTPRPATPGSRSSCAWAPTSARPRPWTSSSPCAAPPPPPAAPSPPAAPKRPGTSSTG